MIPEEDLEDGGLRMLEVDNRVILPELTHIRFIITAADVIHSFASPALAIKCDAYPGRLNQVSVLINREGTFYGQSPHGKVVNDQRTVTKASRTPEGAAPGSSLSNSLLSTRGFQPRVEISFLFFFK
jgi:hypothetical protein